MNKMNQENKQKEYMNKMNKLFSQTLRGSYASKNVVIEIKKILTLLTLYAGGGGLIKTVYLIHCCFI